MQSRQEQKERTRQIILDAALELSGEHGFAGLSLRQVTRASGIVPTGFYRHFDNMEQLGLALVAESFGTLRAFLLDGRRDPWTYDGAIDRSTEILVRVVKEKPGHFAFVARERFGGVPAVRVAIRQELDQFVSELAVELARFPYLEKWGPTDVQIVAKLFVNNMVRTAEEIIGSPSDRPDIANWITEQAKRQMLITVVGFKDWNSDQR